MGKIRTSAQSRTLFLLHLLRPHRNHHPNFHCPQSQLKPNTVVNMDTGRARRSMSRASMSVNITVRKWGWAHDDTREGWRTSARSVSKSKRILAYAKVVVPLLEVVVVRSFVAWPPWTRLPLLEAVARPWGRWLSQTCLSSCSSWVLLSWSQLVSGLAVDYNGSSSRHTWSKSVFTNTIIAYDSSAFIVHKTRVCERAFHGGPYFLSFVISTCTFGAHNRRMLTRWSRENRNEIMWQFADIYHSGIFEKIWRHMRISA